MPQGKAKKIKEDKQASLFFSVESNIPSEKLRPGGSVKSDPVLYGGISIEELVSRFVSLAEKYSGEYRAVEWNGSGEIDFRSNRFSEVQEAMEMVSVLSSKHEFTCVFRVMMFAKDDNGFRYSVNIKLPGVLRADAFVVK